MKNIIVYITCILIFCITGCGKPGNGSDDKGFVHYLIRAGQHYSDQNPFRAVSYSDLKFIVKFDSSAIYQTVSPANQYDINKLYGFSDNNTAHHFFSARVGWRWSDGALRLFGYVYNNGIVIAKELGDISIGDEHSYSVKVTTTEYVFTLNGMSKSIQRTSTTTQAAGYQLYPYFGGDEPAPHDITIRIKEL